MQAYHDREWGVPAHDDRTLFEFLCLEGAQAGLSWRTILAKRSRYRECFCDFEPARVAAMTDDELERVLADPGVVRNRRKIWSVRDNARIAVAVMHDTGSLNAFLWRLAGGEPHQNHWRTAAEVPAVTTESTHMSHALRQRGFGFVGPTICQAFMQAVGMVDDHLVDCFRHGCART